MDWGVKKAMKKIAVVGSLNMDYVVECESLPKDGETIYGTNFFKSVGGKGANQAVAASRLGGDVSMFGSIGEDNHGKSLKNQLIKENISVERLQVLSGQTTGMAFIHLFNSENKITIVQGANKSTNQS